MRQQINKFNINFYILSAILSVVIIFIIYIILIITGYFWNQTIHKDLPLNAGTIYVTLKSYGILGNTCYTMYDSNFKNFGFQLKEVNISNNYTINIYSEDIITNDMKAVKAVLITDNLKNEEIIDIAGDPDKLYIEKDEIKNESNKKLIGKFIVTKKGITKVL